MKSEIVRPSTTDPMTNSQEFPIDHVTSHEELKLFVLKQYFPQYLEETLRQARQTFNVSTIALTASLGIAALGGCLWLTGKATEGTVTGAIATITGGTAALAAKDSEEKMERSASELKLLLIGKE